MSTVEMSWDEEDVRAAMVLIESSMLACGLDGCPTCAQGPKLVSDLSHRLALAASGRPSAPRVPHPPKPFFTGRVIERASARIASSDVPPTSSEGAVRAEATRTVPGDDFVGMGW